MSPNSWTPDSPFQTFVVGSLPRPRWLRDTIDDRKERRVSAAQADSIFDRAIPSAIAMQELAGLDYLSDGEWRRESYIKVFSENVAGFRVDAMPSLVDGPSDPAVVAELEPRGNIAADAALFLKRHTSRRVIVTLPSPYMLGWRMWHPDLSSDAYSTREEFMAACASVLREELKALAGAGVDHVQIDEPWLLMLVDEEHRRRLGMTNMDREIELCVGMINRVVKDAVTPPLSLHLCHGHFRRSRYADGGYEPIIDVLGDIGVDRFAMEFAAPESHGTDVLAQFPDDKVLGLGVVDPVASEIESVDTVVRRVHQALEHVPAERITLNPDCGFSPSSQNPMNLDEAYMKLSVMCEAAGLLCSEY